VLERGQLPAGDIEQRRDSEGVETEPGRDRVLIEPFLVEHDRRRVQGWEQMEG
jgi:hypothetical protein